MEKKSKWGKSERTAGKYKPMTNLYVEKKKRRQAADVVLSYITVKSLLILAKTVDSTVKVQSALPKARRRVRKQNFTSPTDLRPGITVHWE